MAFVVREEHGQTPVLTLNDPRSRNAVGTSMRDDLITALEAANADADIRVIVVKGADNTFCSGGDLAAMPPSNKLNWVAQSLPIMRPAIYPAPPSCAPDARLGPALLGTAFLVAMFVALTVTGAVLQPKRRDKALRVLLIVFVVAAVVAPLWTLTGSGFALGQRSAHSL